ncbi:MAG: signal peptidase II [Chloroflexi bacterium]|nr:signal peptidase II [Chloroflexota bacterium]
MKKAPLHIGKWWNILIFLVIVTIVIVLDQVSKQWIRDNVPLGGSLPAMGRLTIVHVQNTGSAFGLFTDQAFLLSIAAAAGLVVVLLFFRYLKQLGLAGGIALSLIFAGALGNLIDRLRLGHVTDFIYVRLWDNFYWPAFNVADSAITTGAILLAVVALSTFGKKHEPGPEAGKKDY